MVGQRQAGAKEEGYLRVRLPGGRSRAAAIREAARRPLKKVDCVALDCDGVLVDSRRSYDATIRVTVEAMVKEITGKKFRLGSSLPSMIAAVRRTGGFNNDWDATYSFTLFSVLSLGEGPPSRAAGRLKRIVSQFVAGPPGVGQRAVDSFLDSAFPSARDYLKRAREHLGYPGSPPECRMATVFDEVYFGSALFERLRGFRASARRKGLVELERTMVKVQTLKRLAGLTRSGKLAMVTGRPYLGTSYSLGEKAMSYFDRDASTYIGDADVYPDLKAELERYRKPSGEGLVRAAERLSGKALLYIGDSAEDLMMARNARGRLLPDGVLFAGVYEVSPEPGRQAKFFEGEGADLVTESVNNVPPALEAARS